MTDATDDATVAQHLRELEFMGELLAGLDPAGYTARERRQIAAAYNLLCGLLDARAKDGAA